MNKNFDLNNTADKINAGKLTIKDNSTLTVSKGEIDVNSEMDIQSGSTLNIAGGKATLNDETWNGNVSMSAGELILAQAKETTANSKYKCLFKSLEILEVPLFAIISPCDTLSPCLTFISVKL